MALLQGVKPTVFSSVLTGLAQTIYSKRLSNGIVPAETAITTTIGSTTFTEATATRQTRILKAKLDAWVTADAIVSELTSLAVVTIPIGIPVSTAGTAAAQTGATTSPATGTIS